MKTLLSFLAAAALLTAGLAAQVPQIINYQGRVAIGTTNFNGSGSFKFALVNAAGTTTYWSNDGTSTAGGQPTAAVSLTVTKGLYSVLLGDATLPNMTAIPATVFVNSDVRLRVWFNDGANGSQLLTPDQRIAAVGYAMVAGTVPDGAISSVKIAPGAVASAQIANGAVGSTQLASGLTLGGNTLLSGTLSLPVTTSASAGVLNLGGSPFFHDYGASGLSSGNTFLGETAGNFTMTGVFNTGLGAKTLMANTTGERNTANGYHALLANTTGNYNTATGFLALASNTSGESNTSNGTNALYSNTTGSFNTAGGHQAMFANSIGIANSAFGHFALSANTTASQNVALGTAALLVQSYDNGGNIWNSNNIAIGVDALRFNQPTSFTNGMNNTALGTLALRINTIGANNIAIGYNAGSNLTVGNNNIAIGHPGAAGESNVIRIGDGTTQTHTYLTGIVHGNGSGLTGISVPAANVTGTIAGSQLASGLTLGGTTAGTFSGPLTGNVTGNVSGSAASFTGSLAGDVTGTQGATAVAKVGNSTAANIHAAELLANAATHANIPNTIMMRQGNGDFNARTFFANGNIDLPMTSSPSVGVLTQGGSVRLLHTYGGNFFAGTGAGNFSMTGGSNTGIGSTALASNTTGTADTAIGFGALFINTTGHHDTAVGWNALASNLTGIGNTSVGANAMGSNRSASENVAIGQDALQIQSYSPGGQWASNNVAVGYAALIGNQPTSQTTGINNTAVGHRSLEHNTTGANNIAVGNSAGSNLNSGDNNIDIGHTGVGGESNTIRIGDGTTQTDTYLTGTVHSGATLQGTGTGTNETPDRAIITRRIRSTTQALNSVVARTDKLTLERDNTKGGFLIRYASSSGNTTIAATGLTSTGAAVSFYQALANPAGAGTITLWTDAQNVAYFRLQFGNTFSPGNQMTIEISRYSNTDNFWTGVLTSTVDQ